MTEMLPRLVSVSKSASFWSDIQGGQVCGKLVSLIKMRFDFIHGKVPPLLRHFNVQYISGKKITQCALQPLQTVQE